MGRFVADTCVKKMVETGMAPRKAKVVIMGLTFKENCPDIRNSKVADIIKRLQEYGITPIVTDDWADKNEAKREYNVELTPLGEIHDADCIILAVAHKAYRELKYEAIQKIYGSIEKPRVFIDVKGVYDLAEMKKNNINSWRL